MTPEETQTTFIVGLMLIAAFASLLAMESKFKEKKRLKEEQKRLEEEAARLADTKRIDKP